MPGFLVDTNVLSELSRSKPDPGVAAFMSAQDDLWLSAITIHEIDYGIERAPGFARRNALTTWRDRIVARFGSRVIHVDLQIASTSGMIRGSAANNNQTRDPLDMLIAGTALRRDLTLVTRNIRHFEGLGLRLLDPFST
jgi:toxin FitB